MRVGRFGFSFWRFTAQELYTEHDGGSAGVIWPIRARSAVYFFSAAMYTAKGSRESCATEEIFCSDDCVVSRVFADFTLRRCCKSLKVTVCGAADMLMT